MPPTGSQSSRGLRRTSWYLTSTSPVPHQYIYIYIITYYIIIIHALAHGVRRRAHALARGVAIHARQARSEQRHAAQAELAAARQVSGGVALSYIKYIVMLYRLVAAGHGPPLPEDVHRHFDPCNVPQRGRPRRSRSEGRGTHPADARPRDLALPRPVASLETSIDS